MTVQEIHSLSLRDENTPLGLVMDGEIEGTQVYFHRLEDGERLVYDACADFARILILCDGTAKICCGDEQNNMGARDIFIQPPKESLWLQATSTSSVLVLHRMLNNAEFEEFSLTNSSEVIRYDEAATYKEDCKSEKTVSRMLIPTRVIPRFTMGSVQTCGDDRVEKHSHPMLEQFFFGLSDNNCTAMIDDINYPFGPDTLLHIPLGSNHGILSEGNQSVHYLWLDFLFDDEGIAYLDNAHKMNED